MRILVDENIPFAEAAFSALGKVCRLPGHAITAETLAGADVLLVRSVTRVDRSLLAGSSVRFVGSATIGTDHVDRDYLGEAGIAFAYAPGSNADSVVEYVLASLLRLAERTGEPLRGKALGILGCGNIGGRLARRAPALGLRVLPCDPPLADAATARGEPHAFRPFEEVVGEADIVTLHVPLTRIGAYPTHHLIDTDALARMKPTAWLVNSARGAAVDNAALRKALARKRLAGAVLDVWENEPTPDLELVWRTTLATPHIAGYSYDGKVAGTLMLYRALCEFLGREPVWAARSELAPAQDDDLALRPPPNGLDETAWLDALGRQLYDVGADDARMRKLLDGSSTSVGPAFTQLRKSYPRRRTFGLHTIPREAVPDAYWEAVTNGLGVRPTAKS